MKLSRKLFAAIIIIFIFGLAFTNNAVFAADVVSDIDANGSDGPFTLPEGDNLIVTVALNPGNHAGENVDWWVHVTSPFGRYWYTLNSGWQPSDTPIRVYEGPLFNLPSYIVLDMSTLPAGGYDFSFEVDNMDGIFDIDYTNNPEKYTDHVSVKIGTGGINTYNLPDTGQWQYFMPILGMDSDYTINPPSYTDWGDGTVTDNNTFLMWQQEDDDAQMDWDSAESYCDGLSLADFSDWRLPAVQELNDIVDYGASKPSINETYFPNTKTSVGYWSSTVGSSPEGRWTVIYYYYGETAFSRESGGFGYVRCVRGASSIQSFTDNGDGTVTDNLTGFMWQQEDDGAKRVWEPANTYCEALTLAGYNDWRVPNIRELRSIVDYGESTPMIDETYFPNTKTGGYWSSTADVHRFNADRGSTDGHIDTVRFESARGVQSNSYLSYSTYVRCIRGEGN